MSKEARRGYGQHALRLERAIVDVAQVENPASEAVRREREESVTKFT
jgi:hypothetical protein